MVENILFIPVIFGFLVTLLTLPHWIRKAKSVGLHWEDMHKLDRRKVPGSGGIAVLLGFVIGVASYIATKTFIFETDTTTVQIFALLATILIAGMVGLIDDFLGWAQGGLPWKLRIFLMLIASIPMIVINAGESTIFGVEVGLFWPLFFVPFGIVGASTTFNLMGGHNGLESTQGILILSGLAGVAWFTGNTWLTLISLVMVFCLIAFYFFNRNPASIFPGDVLTYPVGALIAILAILGNMERIAIVFFIPYIIETVLKVRGRLEKQSFGKLNSDGSLDVPYEKFYGLEHIAIYVLKKYKGKASERDVVHVINLFQIAIIIIGFILFGGHLF